MVSHRCPSRRSASAALWHRAHHPSEGLHQRHLAGRHRRRTGGDCVVPHRGLQQHRLLSIDRRPAKLAYTPEQLLKPVHAHSNVLCQPDHSFRARLHFLCLAQHRQ